VVTALNAQITDETAGEWPDGEGPLRRDPAEYGDTLIVDVRGFEGPLDLLLELDRHHRVDLAQISILAMFEHYLSFIERAR
jgi:segregation and condensation protein A